MKPTNILLLLILLSFKSGLAQNYTEILGRPTDSSITNSVLFDLKSEVYWEFGNNPGNYTQSTNHYIALKDTTLMVNMENLLPDTRYYYRTRYRVSGSTSAFLAGPEHNFYTQRATGSTFTFTIEADDHLYDKKGVRSEYQICLANQAKDKPDFMLDLGDMFGDDHYPNTITSAQMKALHLDYRQYLGAICHSIPLYLCIGNHEGEKDYYLHQNPPNNIAVYATLWRKFYYPNPEPNHFYSGNTDIEGYGMGNAQNYYSWTWGDALFVVLDVYRYDCDTSAKPKSWNWTLGQAQYDWLKSTLESSKSKYKFVFAHHVTGEGRGGILQAKLFEWGGYEQDGVTYTFASKRPNMAKPIHKLFVDNGVNIFFQGHDHLFAHEIMDGVTYQEVPMPSDSTYMIGMLANAGAYTTDTIPGSGHLRVTVAPSGVKVDFIRAYLPADTLSGLHHNGEIAFTYHVAGSNTVKNTVSSNDIKVYPNPVNDKLRIIFPEGLNDVSVCLYSLLGKAIKEFSYHNIAGTVQELYTGNIPDGIYILNVMTAEHAFQKEVVISH